jgi:excinuclease ABC subunit B
LDLPEVSLVAIMEADKEGFLRAERALVQTIGRAARNVGGQVFLYADRITDSMDKALRETNRRREIQKAHNLEHNITPQTIVKETSNSLLESLRGKPEAWKVEADDFLKPREDQPAAKSLDGANPKLASVIRKLEKEMKTAAKNLDFERAAELRDQLLILQQQAAKARQNLG